ncbi:MAG: membrane protein insertase YidC [Actinomycetota bacterium]|nr:membrane protein insertase YidC [Actinomycetota bacterium]
MTSAVFASTLGNIVHPLFVAFAWLLAEFYSVVPNYAIAIALLTVTVMIVVFPITRRGTRSMMRMQVLAPEMKALQAKYKPKQGMATVERQELRQKLNEEMMALYKENGVSPTGGCLPMFLQFPIFWILYSTIRGLTHEVTVHGVTSVQPLYISHTTRLYESIVHSSSGKLLPAFGINLSDSVRTAGLSWPQKIPYIVMILVAIALQYVQMKQLSGRNPAAAQANPQMQQMQKVMPLIFAVIYISIPAGVNVYFIVSSLFRIGQQEFMYRRDPQLQASLAKLHERAKNDPKALAARALSAGEGSGGKGLLGRIRSAALQGASDGQGSSASARPSGATDGTSRQRERATQQQRSAPRPKPSPRTTGSATRGGSPPNVRKPQPRAQGKRARRPR